jgi:hypothetical protein
MYIIAMKDKFVGILVLGSQVLLPINVVTNFDQWGFVRTVWGMSQFPSNISYKSFKT